ncbi:MAG: coenzyme F420-0:L-glutamate ligase, partial [Bacteroidia bacterium]
MKIKAFKTKIFKQNENLISFIEQYLPKISERSILIVTSKIVALAEGRFVKYTNKKDKERIIKAESEFTLKTKYVFLTIKN